MRRVSTGGTASSPAGMSGLSGGGALLPRHLTEAEAQVPHLEALVSSSLPHTWCPVMLELRGHPASCESAAHSGCC